LSTITEALESARREAQDLHKKAEAATAKDHAALRADLQSAAAQAQKLAASLRAVINGQRSDAKQHLQNATTQLDDAAKHARDVATAGEAQLKTTNQAMLAKARDAVQSLSRALASMRSTAGKA